MIGGNKKSLKKLLYVGMFALAVAGGVREVRAELIFENIPVIVAPGDQITPVIWGNYIVWRGAQNEAYDIDQRQIVQMPGLNIDGEPAIWENKVVWAGGDGYYDLNLRQMVYPASLSVGSWPAMHNNKIVWGGSTGYYDLSLGQMINPPGFSINYGPDIFQDKIVWSDVDGYFDIGLQQMVYPDGLHIGRHPAIYDNKITWNHLVGMYYDIETQQYFGGGTMVGIYPDIFEDSFVWNNYDAVPPVIHDIYLWDPVHKKIQITESGYAAGAKIYNDIVVWTDWRNGNGDIYMAVIPEPSTMVLLGAGLAGLLSCTKRRRNYH